jgi:signal transduction histidine kinase
MANRFKLTTGFLLVSVVIFAAAALVITRSATRNEEANVVHVISAQSNKDARVIAEVVTGLMANPATDSAQASPADSSAAQSLAISAFLRTSGIVRLSLFDAEGGLIWSSDKAAVEKSEEDIAFNQSVIGEMSSSLTRNEVFTTFDGRVGQGDVVATFIPLLDAGTEQTSQVLEVARDVTTDLNTRIDTARSSMFQTVFGALGGSFVILFGVVLSADMLIWRSRTRALSNERALADEKVVAKSLELENQQLRDINDERDRFLSMVSHELRTPLTSMLGFTDVLSRNQAGEKRERNLKQLELMRRNGDHLNSLIEDLLESTRIQNGQFEIEKERFRVDDVVYQVSQTASALLKPRGQKLTINNTAQGAELHGDRRRVVQILLNLLSNASKYSPSNSKITLTLEVISGSLRMTVGDEGAGIPEEDRKLLFERFYRRDDEVTRSQSGLGLGLSIVKAIVEAHRGVVDVQSEVGVGTNMVVTLPGARTAAQMEAAKAPSETIEAIAAWRKEMAKAGDLRGLGVA